MESESISSQFLYMNECNECKTAKDAGVEAFIIHLVNKHSIPTEWPSERAERLTGAEAKKPYTTVAATRKKRRKATTPRPLNSFMVFAQHVRRNVLAIFDSASSSNVSRLLGEAWNTIPKEVRAAYDEEASRLARIHSIEFPTYKYQPKPRQWLFNSSVTPASPTTSTSDEIPPTQAPQKLAPTSSVPWLSRPPSTFASTDSPASPAKIKSEPLCSPPSSPLTVQPTSLVQSRMLIRDSHSKSLRPKPSPLVKIAPATHNQNNLSSTLSPSLIRSSSTTNHLIPFQENNVPPAESQFSDGSAQQRLSTDLATLHKLINQAATTSTAVHQIEQISTESKPKPCILLTPLQSDIGQQAIISCGQSSTIPTLFTCDNTVYIALMVMQSPIHQTTGVRIPENQEQSVATSTALSAESLLGENLVDLLRSLDASQIHSSVDCRLAEMLRAAAVATTTTTNQ